MQLAEPAPGAEPRPGYYSVGQVAQLLGVSRVSVWRWISSGKLPVARLGHRTVRIKHQDVEQLARAHRRESQATIEFAPLAQWQPSGAAEHVVMFYDAQPFLLDTVAGFIAPALIAGDRGLLVSTPEHRAGIEDRLRAAGIDLEAAHASGHYRAEDASATLARFMVDGTPDWDRFEDVVDDLIGSPARTRDVRVFGEMVALLAASGKPDAATALEELWQRAQGTRPFLLLCAYPIHQFGGQDMAAALSETCLAHSSVVPAESYSALNNRQDRLREIAALQQKAATLERELHRRDEFLSIASHELRTPLAVLGLQAQLTLRQWERSGELDSTRVLKSLRTIDQQAGKLSRLIDQLMDVSRLDTGKLVLQRKMVDLAELVTQVVVTARTLSDEHPISFSAPERLGCEVDPLRLEQVLVNLLDNAVKYSPAETCIEVDLRQTEFDEVELSVRDFGPGIPPEKRAHVFERFFQAHEKSGQAGLGLGLFLSRTIVELHGGEIIAEFPPDGGTRFVIRLPVRDPATAAA